MKAFSRSLSRRAAFMACLAALACGSGCEDEAQPSAPGTRPVWPTRTPSASASVAATATATPTAFPPPATATASAPPATPTTTPDLESLSAEVAPSLEQERDGTTLLLAPVTPLRGGRAYGLVLTTAILSPEGYSLQADAFFKQLTRSTAADGPGPKAYFSADPESPRNPYPDPRLVRADGTVRVPDRFALGGLEGPTFTTARAFLRRSADDLESIAGFSTTAPIRIALSGPVNLATVNDRTLRFFERPDGGLDLDGLLLYAREFGLRPEDIALGISFPTQPIDRDLRAIRDVLLSRNGQEPIRVTFEDPDPNDDLAIGVFGPEDAEFPPSLRGSPEIATVAVGLLSSPDFRGEDGVFVPARVSGDEPAPFVPVDVIVVIPSRGSSPHPVVILQHGFAGSNLDVLWIAPALAREGLAAVAISAVSHGRRGSPFDLLTSRSVQVRDIFRQTIADQMALVRAIEAGINADADGAADLDPSDIGYLGQSLGAILGSVFVGVEDAVRAAVLNVGGGRVAFLGRAPAVRPIYTGYYASEVGLDPASAEFERFLARLLELGQHALDPADPLNFARRWRIEPFPGAPPHRILLQEGIGDEWVPNEFTEALAAVGHLPANQPASDPAGTSGLWRWDPPGGHAILGERPEVLAQAVRFLASRGTEIAAP